MIHRRFVKIMAVSLSVLPSVCAVSSCKSSPNLPSLHKGEKQDVAGLVKTVEATAQSSVMTLSYPGKVIPREDVNVSFRVAGPIAEVKVKPGQRVRRGEVMVQMDDRDYKIQLAATEAEYMQIKAEAERVIELADRNSATQNDRDKAAYGLRQITAKYDAHKNALDDTKLRAPFDGYVQKVYFDAGETVSAGLPVISMISGSSPEVEISIPSEDFIKRDSFSGFSCTLDVYPERSFPVRLINMTKKANLNQLFTARFAFPQEITGTEIPYAGMTATVHIDYDYAADHLVGFPIDAVFEEGGDSMIWVVGEDSAVRRRAVKPVEIKRDGMVFVTEGVSKGEKVVVAGVHSLKEGQKVRVMAPESATNPGNLL